MQRSTRPRRRGATAWCMRLLARTVQQVAEQRWFGAGQGAPPVAGQLAQQGLGKWPTQRIVAVQADHPGLTAGADQLLEQCPADTASAIFAQDEQVGELLGVDAGQLATLD